MSRVLSSSIVRMLLKDDTRLLRFFFSFASFSYGLWALFDPLYTEQHTTSLKLFNGSTHMMAVLFIIHSFATLYGVLTKRFSVSLLFIEGLLGSALWGGIGFAEAIQQGVPGPMLVAGGSISLFLLARYPTHYDGTAND